MGKDKLKRFAEIEDFENVVEVSYSETVSQDFQLQGKWKKDFFKNENPVVLELACGGGEYTVGLARLYPNINFIGVDIKGNRIWKGAKIAIEENLKNVGFLRTRIDFIDQFFGPNEVQDIWITFADPQPQKNRARKRLTHPLFLNRYRKFLEPQGKIKLKCDSELLYDFTKEVIQEQKLKVSRDHSDIYSDEFQNAIPKSLQSELDIKTFYERKWLAEDKKIKYLEFEL